jgi:hypothetical protein
MPDASSDRYIITNSEKAVLKYNYEDAAKDIAERLGRFDQMRDYDGTFIYDLDDTQTEQGMKQTKRLLKRCFLNYLLYQWYLDVGLDKLASEYAGLYESFVEKYRTNSTQPSYIHIKAQPYF